MLIFTTSISGSGRKEYLKNFVEYAKKRGKNVKVYFVGNMLFDRAKKVGINITPENVLNANPNVINALRSAVFEEILGDLPQDLKKNDAVIISVHTLFYWKNVFRRAYDYFYLNQINPDMFITFIDGGDQILERLNVRAQWKPERLTAHEVLLWQNVEVEMTESLAEFLRKDFFTVPVKQPYSTLYKLMFNRNVEPVYVSMPITHITNPKDLKRIDDFIKKLDKYFTVFDPRTIETGSVKLRAFKSAAKKEDELATHQHTVARDLYWLLKQSKKIIAFFPQIVSSPGVINELREAFETNKDVWLIYPNKVGSPFITYFCNRLFLNEREFFKFLEKELKLKPLKL